MKPSLYFQLSFTEKRIIFAVNYKNMKYTLIIKAGKDGFLIGQLKELPEVFTQGLSIDEVKENIADALDMYLEDLREQYEPQGEMIEEMEMSF